MRTSTHYYLLLLAALATSFQMRALTNCEAWKLKKEVEGIKIYTRTPANSNLKELKTITHYKTTLTDLVDLMGNKESCPQWVCGCSKSYFHKKIKETETYHYQETALHLSA